MDQEYDEVVATSFDILRTIANDSVLDVLDNLSDEEEAYFEDAVEGIDSERKPRDNLIDTYDSDPALVDKRPVLTNPRRKIYSLNDLGQNIYESIDSHRTEADDFEGFISSFTDVGKPAYLVLLNSLEQASIVDGELAQDIGCSKSTLKNYLDTVDELGLVNYIRTGKYESNRVASVTEEGEKAIDFVEEIVGAVDEELDEQEDEQELKLWEKTPKDH